MKHIHLLTTWLLLTAITTMSCAQSKYATQDTPAPSVTNSSAHKKYAMNINQNEGNPRLYASDNIISRDFKLTDFKRIHLSSYGNIRYEYSRQPRVSIRTSDNVFDVVTVKVENETLTIDFKKDVYISLDVFDVIVGSPQLEEVKMNGMANLQLAGNLTTDRLKIHTSGICNVTADGNITCKDKLELNLEGISKFNLAEQTKAKDIKIGIDGIGHITAGQFVASNTMVFHNSGVGESNVKEIRTDVFNCNISGAGKIKCKNFLANDTRAQLSGTGSMELGGATQRAHYTVKDCGKVIAGNLKTETTDASVGNAGSIECYAEKQLHTTTADAGQISYAGNPVLNHSGSMKPKKL